jgi:hypothetical protein
MLTSATLGINHASIQLLTPKQRVAASRVVTSAVPYGRASSARSLVVHGSDPIRVNAGGWGRGEVERKRVPTHSTPSSRLSASRQNVPSSPPVAKMTVQADTEIVKSPMDKRLYRRLVLANGLSVLLISDPEMTDAAATEADEEVSPRPSYEKRYVQYYVTCVRYVRTSVMCVTCSVILDKP